MIHDIIELLRKLCSAGMPSVFSYEQEHGMLEGNECRVEDSKPIAVMCDTACSTGMDTPLLRHLPVASQ